MSSSAEMHNSGGRSAVPPVMTTGAHENGNLYVNLSKKTTEKSKGKKRKMTAEPVSMLKDEDIVPWHEATHIVVGVLSEGTPKRRAGRPAKNSVALEAQQITNWTLVVVTLNSRTENKLQPSLLHRDSEGHLTCEQMDLQEQNNRHANPNLFFLGHYAPALSEHYDQNTAMQQIRNNIAEMQFRHILERRRAQDVANQEMILEHEGINAAEYKADESIRLSLQTKELRAVELKKLMFTSDEAYFDSSWPTDIWSNAKTLMEDSNLKRSPLRTKSQFEAEKFIMMVDIYELWRNSYNAESVKLGEDFVVPDQTTNKWI